MPKRRVLLWAIGLLIATALSIFLIDRPLAAAVAHLSPSLESIASGFVTGLEYLFLFNLSKFASGALVALIGLALMFKRRQLGQALLFIGVAQLTTRLITGVLKNVFARPRPFEGPGAFFTGGSSFPSGHAAHFWGFYFAVALVAPPRYRWPLLAIAILGSTARVMANDHYLSDVLASAAIAAVVALAWSAAYRGRREPDGQRDGGQGEDPRQ
ncbi:MAG TPA: phosphatase PAP2 family protein [Thermoanaerobaculia bacterium]|nr:phosphatase PAP2 family protein [Thermoanaerobaculia bacterium]